MLDTHHNNLFVISGFSHKFMKFITTGIHLYNTNIYGIPSLFYSPQKSFIYASFYIA